MTLGSLFSGIGGIDLGFQRAGFEIAWQVEIDKAASSVLARHYPNVPIQTGFAAKADGKAHHR